jgi:autotransporter-associated beta strand protein
VTASAGSAALAADTSANLDLSAFGSLSLGATGTFNYNGTSLTANGSTYRLGGGGGTLGITSSNVLTGAANLVVTGNTVQLKSAQDYSGATSVNGGTLELRGAGTAGSILNTSGIIVNSGAAFTLTNDATNGVNLNRVADNTAITLNSGVFNFGASNAGSTTFSETVGQLNVSLGGHNRIVTPGTVVAGSTSTLTFASLNRTAGTTLSFGTTANLGTALNKILFTAAPTVDAGGLIGGWATAGSQDFAAYGANGVVVATSTATNAAETGWATGQNVKITTAQTLTSNRAINALSVVSPATATALNLGGFTLRLESGGILGSQSAASNPSITNGNLTAGVGVDTNADLFLLDSQGSTGRFITISANIVDNGAGVVSLVTNAGVNGNTGGLLIISGTNTYTGTTTLAGGQTTLGSSTGINNSKTLTIATGATLNMGGFTATVDALLGGGALDARSTSGSATSNNTISIGNSNGSGTFTGSFNVAGSSTRDMDIIKNGTGTQVLAGSDFRDVTAAAGGSTTTINNGTLQFARQASLYNNNTSDWNASNIIVNSGGTLALSVGGTGEFTSANVDTIKGLGSATGGFKSGSTLGLDTTNAVGGTFTYASAIGDTNSGANSVGLIKLGAGKLELTSVNTYTGKTIIRSGTLLLSGAGSIATSSGLEIASGATFDAGVAGYNLTSTQTLSGGGNFTGTINVAGTLSPGNSPGTLSTGTEVWQNGGDYNWQVANATGAAGVGYDTIAVTGNLDLSGLTAGGFGINLWSLSSTGPDVNGDAANFSSSLTQSWTLLTASGGISGFDATDFTISVAANNGTGGFTNANSGAFALSQVGSNLVLTYSAVPEPSAAELLCGFGALATLRRRRA